jgi:predicted nucleic acid-binding protein
VTAALDFHAQGFDFADALHLASSDATEAIYTFDEQFVRKGMHSALPVKVVPDK